MLTRLLGREGPPPYLPASRIHTGRIPGLVSVVLPVCNGARYLREALNSILAQTLQTWELVVVDDGSVDESGAIAQEYARRDSRIRVIRQENQKLPRALNRGFGETKGEFLTWTSADNRLLPRCLEVLAGELAASPETDMLFGNMTLIDQAGAPLTHHGWFELPPGSGRVMLPASTALLNTVANNTIGAAFLYRSGVEAVLGGYSPRLYLLEDYDYFMRVNSLFHLRHTREKTPLYQYRMHPESLTAQDEALGITASRPRLMAFDARRRAFYRTPLTAWIREDVHPSLRWLRLAGLRVSRTAPPEGRSFRLLFRPPTERDWPEAMPCYLIQPGPPWRIWIMTRELAQQPSQGISFASGEDAGRFLRLRAACDLLRQQEATFFA